jgi:hypothetical protein
MVSEVTHLTFVSNCGSWIDWHCWMALVELVHPQGSYQVSVGPLTMKCDLFKNNPSLTIAPYQVDSRVSLEDFRDFVSALEDKPINIKDRNFPGLSQLSEEFGFQALLMKLSTHRRSPGLSDAQTAEIQSRLSAVEERAGQHEDQIRRFEADLARLASELEAIRNPKNSDTARPAVAPPPSAPATPPPTAASHPSAPAKPPPTATPPAWPDPVIVREFSPLFDEWRAKRFNLLWQGSRDGFGAKAFHDRCDGRANTLTIIQDTDGNVFGGFTPVEWASPVWNNQGGDKNNTLRGDDSLRSFLFTLRNPHSVPPRKFALKAEGKHRAIICRYGRGPVFGDLPVSDRCCIWQEMSLASGCISVSSDCNANEDSSTHIGTHWSDREYANDTDVEDFFTGAERFTVGDIRVYQITD